MRLDTLHSCGRATPLAIFVALSVASCSGAPSASNDGGAGGSAGGGGASGAGTGGVAGTGGAAGSSGSGGAGGNAGTGGAVRIIRGDPNEQDWFSLVIEGRGLANDEGKLVTARIGEPGRPPERLGSGQVRIQDGAFRIEFPQGCEGFLYKRKVLYIDVNGDGSCTVGVDRVYVDYRFQTGDLTLTLSDSIPAAPGNVQMRLSSTDPPAGSECQYLNEPWPGS